MAKKLLQNPKFVAGVFVFALAAVLGAGSLLAREAILRPPVDSIWSVLLMGAFFVGVGCIAITATPSTYGRFGGFLFGWLGSLAVAVGLVFIDAGFAVFLLSRFVLFAMWGLQVLMVAAILAASFTAQRRHEPSAPKAKAGFTDTLASTAGVGWSALFCFGAAVVLLGLVFL